MGCGGSSTPESVELDLKWTPTELGDYVLDLEEEKISLIFESKAAIPKHQLAEVLHLSLYFYLVYKNQRLYPNQKASNIENQMKVYKNDEKLRNDVEPIAKWMLENKIPRN
eukprot:70438_1